MKAYNQLSDAELCAALKASDERAYTEIYNRYWDKIYTVAVNRLNDKIEAEEVLQDVFFSLWKRRTALDIQYSLNTYLSVAVKYQIINHQSRQLRKASQIATHISMQEPAIDSTQLWFSEKELQHQLTMSINKLPEKCRIVFKMSREEYKTNSQIATELGLSEKTVEAHITRALAILKTSLKVSIPLLMFLLKK
jgi:RNA polymerase sigma-70 factor (family 1)